MPSGRGVNAAVQRRGWLFVALPFLLGFIFSLVPWERTDYSLSEALKVLGIIEMVRIESGNPDDAGKRTVVISESELNSYIAYLIEAEKEPVLRELRLKLLDGNRVEGKIKVDLRGADLPKMLRPEMTFFLGGKLEAGEGRIRLDLKDLFLESRHIQPVVLDLVIYIGSKLQSTEPWSLKDWFDLPYGIQDVEIHRGRAVFRY